MVITDIDAEWHAMRERWEELFSLLDTVNLRLSARSCAKQLGLRSDDALERELRHRGLPRYRDLRDWFYVVKLSESCGENHPLATFAFNRGDYPSVLYRFVFRVTGETWRRLSMSGAQALRQRAMIHWKSHGQVSDSWSIGD